MRYGTGSPKYHALLVRRGVTKWTHKDQLAETYVERGLE